MNVLAFETCWAKNKASDISWSIFIQHLEDILISDQNTEIIEHAKTDSQLHKGWPINSVQDNTYCLQQTSQTTHEYNVCGQNAEVTNVKRGDI